MTNNVNKLIEKENWMSLYPFDHHHIEPNLSAFKDEIDLQQIYEKGYFATQISEPFLRMALRTAKGFEYTPYTMDSIEHGEAAEYDLVKDGLPPVFKILADSIMAQCAQVFALFHCPEAPVGAELGVAELSRGYFVDWHQDSYSQGVMYFAAILAEEDFEEGEGGVLQFAKLKYNDYGFESEKTIVEEFPTNTKGQIVFFDPCNLNFQHRCTKINTDKKRYLFFGSIGEVV